MPVPGRVPFIDTHCHLADRSFDRDRDDVIARAREAGVAAAVVMGEDLETNVRVLELASRYSFILPALGHHPWRVSSASRDVPQTLKLLEEHRDRVVAIGEVGLDYRTGETEEARALQRSVFKDFLEAGKRLRLPLSVHVRSAGHHVIRFLKEHAAGAAVLHAFDGKARYAVEGVDAGMYFSIPATVLVSAQKRKLVRAIPLDRILLESDCPALGPESGTRNEPSVIKRSAAEIAVLKEVTVATLARAALANSRAAFGLRTPSSLSGETGS